MEKGITTLIIDDQALVRGSIAAWLRTIPGFDVVAECADADEGVNAAIRVQPQVVLCDIAMPGLLCFDAVRLLKTRCPNTRVLFLSGYGNDTYIKQALAVEAAGYLCKSDPLDDVAQAIRTAAAGGVHFTKRIRDRLVIDGAGIRLSEAEPGRPGVLSEREAEILVYIASGMSKKEIAATVHLSVKTVDNHVSSIMKKLDLHDRVDLTRYAIREGLLLP